MKLRFQVSQAECFRKGINCDKSHVTIEVDPKEIKPEIRNLIADHLEGIDVIGIVANEPTFTGLLEALLKKQDL